MSLAASGGARPVVAVGAIVLVMAAAGAAVLFIQQALAARPPTGYQLAVVNVAREFGLAPQRPAFVGNGQTRGGAPAGGGAQLGVAAQAIGISVDQLRQELASATLAQVAQTHGVDPSAVATAMKDASNAQLDAAASDSRLTPDQASQRKLQTQQRIDQLMTQVAPLSAAGRVGR